jgi:SAM-dependent methyltransferase
VASATELPFENAQFDLVVAYNILMDVDDVPSALKELRRVMRPTGQLIISVCHPFADRGRFASKEIDAPFVLEGTYSGRQRFEGVEERDGLRMRCTLLGGVIRSNPTGWRWRKRDSRSPHFVNLSLTWMMDGTTWRLGFACRCFFG